MVLGWSSALVAQQVDPALEKLKDEYQAAVNKGDAKALPALYTTDAFRLSGDGKLLVGRAEIEKDLVAQFAGPSNGIKVMLRLGRQMLGPDVATTEGTWEATVGSSSRKGRYMTVAKREGGQWLLRECHVRNSGDELSG